MKKKKKNSFKKTVYFIFFGIGILLLSFIILNNRLLYFSKATQSAICNVIPGENFQELCCSQDDINTGRFKCLKMNNIYYQFHCNAGRYWQCQGRCTNYDTCIDIILNPYYELFPPTPTLTTTKIPSLTPTKIPTLTMIPTPTPQLISLIGEKYRSFFDTKNIDWLANRGAVLKVKGQNPNETIPKNLADLLHQMLDEDIMNSKIINYVFNVKYEQYYSEKDYVYYYIYCSFPPPKNTCFKPNDSKCSQCQYAKMFDILLNTDNTKYKEKNKKEPFVEWYISGYLSMPPENVFPAYYGVNKEGVVYTLAYDEFSATSALKEETINLSENMGKVFITIPFQGGGLLILEIVKDNKDIIFRGIFLPDF